MRHCQQRQPPPPLQPEGPKDPPYPLPLLRLDLQERVDPPAMENSSFYQGFPIHVKREVVELDSRTPRIRCEGCGGTDFDSGDDGFFYCRGCGGQSQDMLETACADEDVFGDGGGAGALYSAKHVRHTQSQSQPQPLSQFLSQSSAKASKEEIVRSLARNLDGCGVVKEEDRTHEFVDEVYRPMDFGSAPSLDEKAVADGIRLRYVQGMQLMIQMQCKELVEGFGVSPLICGVVGVVWLRYLAVLRVFDEDWADRAIQEAEAAARERCGGKDWTGSHRLDSIVEPDPIRLGPVQIGPIRFKRLV
ncbi:hypothetical protein Taro_049829 [Colocasia esculenta]|uniref:TATA box-binding protein-associated factor RNA polymerase I subunit B n=1 Tax=Colocasia esculenta TaxID=4460 RepID=A0A843XCB0_COLES|nr:hypothetical protein [Colocasia esculenta]